MSFFKRITDLFAGRPSSDSRMLDIYVLSRRCNEPIAGQIDLFNELSQTDDEEHDYFTRKVLHTSGERRCFDQVEVHLWFDKNKQLARHEVQGGRWLDDVEYQAELARFNAPPGDDTDTG
jgi:hypothetical protein